MPRRLWLLVPLALVALLFAAGSCISFTAKPEEIAARFANRPYQPVAHDVAVLDRMLHYVTVGEPGRPCVVFVHGSPGSWDAWVGFLASPELADNYLVAVDRPGFGGSGAGAFEPSLARQAALIKPAVEACERPAILVGHSLGGPVVARFAMDYPTLVAGLVLVAPSIDPAMEKHTWYQLAATLWVVQWLIPRELVTSNREILPLKAELEALLPHWADIDVPVIVIQGDDDGLVPPENADFAARMLSHAPVEIERLPKQGHLIPWERPDIISAAIRHLQSRLAERAGAAVTTGPAAGAS